MFRAAMRSFFFFSPAVDEQNAVRFLSPAHGEPKKTAVQRLNSQFRKFLPTAGCGSDLLHEAKLLRQEHESVLILNASSHHVRAAV